MKKDKKGQVLLNIGEMASLCRTSKDTLYFYERKGIIRPKVIDPQNGYRYYDTDNFYLMDMILALREAGASVKEIQNWMEHPNPSDHISILEEKSKELDRKIRELTILKERIAGSVALTKKGMACHEAEILLEEQAAEQLYIIYVPDQNDPERYMPSFFELLKGSKEKNIPHNFHASAFISRERLLAGNYNADYFYVSAVKPVEQLQLYEKPAGTYITICHYGPYREISDSYQLLMGEIHKRGLIIDGPAYEESLIGWMNSNQESDYRTRISIKVIKAS